MSVHHQYSPSRLHALSLCPRFLNDENRDKTAANDGTRKHKAVELKRPEMLADEEDRDAVMKCLLVEQQLRAEYPNAVMINEMKLQSSLNNGTGDLVLIDLNQRIGIIRDWKFGVVPVPPPEYNIQILDYGYNLFAMVPEIDRINLGIVQPAVMDTFPDVWIDRSSIPSIKKRFDLIVAEAENPDSEPRPNDNCQYCANKKTCKPWLDAAALTMEENEGLTFPKTWNIMIDVSKEEVAQRAAMIGVFEGLIKQMKEVNNERAKQLAEFGEKVPGFTLVNRKGSLTCNDAAGLFETLHSVYKLSPKQIIEACVSISAKSAVELLNDQCLGTAEQYEKELTEHGLIGRGKPSTYLKKSNNKVSYKELAT